MSGDTLNEVFRKGCLVDLNVSQWLAERRLQPEDLGLQPEEVPPNFVLGHKKLIPAEAIAEVKRWDYQARDLLEVYSHPFPFGGARFVPRPKLLELTSKLDALITGFNGAADALVTKYADHKTAMRTEFLTAAKEAYKRVTLLRGTAPCTEEEYVNAFLARIEKVYPSPKELRGKYSMTYVVFQVELPDITRATYDQIVEDSDRIQLMRTAYTEGIKQRMQEFAEGVARKQREDAARILGHAAERLRNGKRMSNHTLNAVRRLVDRYAAMDLVGDTTLKVRLAEFKKRVLDAYADHHMMEDTGLRKNIAMELEALTEVANDAVTIQQLADGYRKELNV